MKWTNTLMAAVVALSSAGAARADTVIDTIPLWDGSISNGWDKIAQTFEVPITDPVLSTFELGVQSTVGASYHLLLYEWDHIGNSIVGGALFDSGALVAPGTLTFIEFAIGVSLTPGDDYAMIVDWASDKDSSGVAFSEADQYPGGYNDYTDGPINAPWFFGSDSGREMAFKAVFVPAPGALALLGTAGLISRRPRRRRTQLSR
jgi:hypothetical protein